MKVKIITPFKTKDKEILGLEKKYIKQTPWKVEIQEVKKFPDSFNGYVVAMDETGENLSSSALAKKLADKNEVTFIIGEADGLTNELRSRADLKLSFGKLTWPHKIARMMLTEQIYRVWSILNRHPYHRE